MSYGTISRNANDTVFLGRLTAAAAAEGADDPNAAALELVWPVVVSSDIAAAYESAVLADNPNPGGDESVITDQMILSAVQANMPPP
jgi:uncharacterized protein YbjT (DUF2867 family)